MGRPLVPLRHHALRVSPRAARLLLLSLTALAAPARAETAPATYPDHALTEKELGGKTLRELALMRNTIFARAGQPFRKRWLHDYFSAQPWYKAGAVVDPKTLNALDRQNADLLSRYELAIPRAELERRLQQILDRHRWAWSRPVYGPFHLAFSSDGKHVLSSDDSAMAIYDAATGRRLGAGGGGAAAAALLPEPGHVTAFYRHGVIGTWSLFGAAGKQPVKQVTLAGKWQRDAVLAPDGSRLLAGPAFSDNDEEEDDNGRRPVVDPAIVAVDLPSGKVVLRRPTKQRDVMCLGLLPGARRALFVEGDTVTLWDVAAGKPVWQARDKAAAACRRLAVSADGATAVFDSGAVWSLTAGRPLPPLPDTPALAEPVTPAFAADGKRVLVGRALWDLASRRRIATVPGDGDLYAVALSPDGHRALLVDSASRVLWDVDGGHPVATWTGHESWLAHADEQIDAMLLARALGRKLDELAALDFDRSPFEDPALLDQQLSTDSVDHMSRRDLRLLRNMVYARRGRPFRSPIVREYFERTDWYKADASYSDARLTAVDRRNIKVIQSAEIKAGGPLYDRAHAAEDAAEQSQIPEA
jgi:hypothetical protein